MQGAVFQSASGQLDAMRRGELTSRQLVEMYAERWIRLNPRLNAVVVVDWDDARRRADEADAARASGSDWGPLHGVPVSISDCLATAGMRTSNGDPDLVDLVPDTDSPVVGRLKNAGAIVIAKTNVAPSDFPVHTDNQVYGRTVNPWDGDRACGAACGGGAVAVAAGLASIDLGCDTAGGVRIPAGWTGVYAHRPSEGLVPPGGPSGRTRECRGGLAVPGPFARSSRDLDVALRVLAGWRAPSPTGGASTKKGMGPKGIQGLRLAAWIEDPEGVVHPAAREVLEAAITALRRTDVTVVADPSQRVELTDSHRIFQRLDYGARSVELDRAEFRRLLDIGSELSEQDDSEYARYVRFTTETHRDWEAAMAVRDSFRDAWARFFEDHDAIVMPIADSPPRLAEVGSSDLWRDHATPLGATRVTSELGLRRQPPEWATLASLSGLPSTVAPVGCTADRVPVGLQIVADHLQDGTTIAVAGEIERALGGFVPPPGL